jgi:hypothetical protein
MNLRPEPEMRALIAGFDAHLGKTCDDSTLLAVVCGAVNALRKRGLKTGVIVRAIIDAEVALAVQAQESLTPRPRGRG